jgi:hypothetical protein
VMGGVQKPRHARAERGLASARDTDDVQSHECAKGSDDPGLEATPPGAWRAGE